MKKLFITLMILIVAPVLATAAQEVTYYFDGYDSGLAWTREPQYMVDNNTANYAKINYENASEETQLNNSNTCPGTNLGTITKVEIRANVDIWGAGHL